ncbi:MAG: hypothetical protein WCA38_03815 [Candidatus Acidiferrales bacterium]
MSGWVEAFIVIAAVAIVVQMGILLAMLLQMQTAIRKFTGIATDLQTRVEPILTRMNRLLEESEGRISNIISDGAEISRLARGQAQKMDRILTETIERLRVQVIRADQILTGALEVVDDAGTKFRKTLWAPIRQASAVMKGIKVGLDLLRHPEDRETGPDGAVEEDEELFI